MGIKKLTEEEMLKICRDHTCAGCPLFDECSLPESSKILS